MNGEQCAGDVVDDPNLLSIHTASHDALKYPFQVFQQAGGQPQILVGSTGSSRSARSPVSTFVFRRVQPAGSGIVIPIRSAAVTAG
jgi:hypothetical protein